MKLSAYVVRYDTGFAPNPFGRHCTLACCKPAIRRNVEPGDIIVGTAAANSERPGCLIYAMRVQKVISYQEYWDDPAYSYRRPSQETQIKSLGDNIWHQEGSEWLVAPHAVHDESNKKRDISGENVLISTDFYYFGSEAIPIPPEFSDFVASTQGHKNTSDEKVINRFWDWLSHSVSKSGRLGDPSNFTEEACRSQKMDDEEE